MQWVQIEIGRVQPGKPGNFFQLVCFPFQYSSEGTETEVTAIPANETGALSITACLYGGEA